MRRPLCQGHLPGPSLLPVHGASGSARPGETPPGRSSRGLMP